VTRRYRGKLETLIEDLDLPNPVIRSYYRDGSIKQYVRDHLILRTEATSNNVTDFGVPITTDHYRLSSLRYDLSKLRANGLVPRVPHSRRYRLLPTGYRICVLFLKLFERVYAPLTAGLLRPLAADPQVTEAKRHQLDRLYQRLVTDLDALWRAVGLRSAA